MYDKRLRSAVLASIALSSCAPQEPAKVRVVPKFDPIDQACAGRDGWSDAAPPSHVFANVYMVGTCGIVSLLITTPEGHFLIDGATAEAAPGIAENIRKLGFDPKDVRYLLGTHEHIDHVGGLAELKRITGAQFVTRAAAQSAMEGGAPHPTDPQRGAISDFEGINADFLIEDGKTLRIGGQEIRMIATPGHTPGGSSWTWKSCDGRLCRQIVFADSLNAVSADGYRFSDHPEYVATLRQSIAKLGTVTHCDIVIGGHPAQTRFFERLSAKEPLVNAAGCKDYANAATSRLDARLAKEAMK